MSPVRRAELAAALLVTALALLLHSDVYHGAGPLWRDEIAALHIATGPLPAMPERLQYESFPILSFLAIGGWVGAAGDALVSLRLFGAVIGVLLLIALWIAACALGARVPLLSLGMAGVTAAVVRFGDAFRGHGLGCILGVLTLAMLYRTVTKPSVLTWIGAGVVAMLAVHTTYYAAIVVLAACVAAAVAQLDRGNKRGAIAAIGVGAIAALTLLAYVPVFRAAGRWNDLTRFDVGPAWVWSRLYQTLALSGSVAATLWVLLFVIAIAVAVVLLVMRVTGERRTALLFCSTALAILGVGFFAFFLALRYLMQPWYFIVFITCSAVLIDAIVAHALEPSGAWALARAAAAIALAFVALNDTRELLAQRATQMDSLVARLTKELGPNDLIIVYPWSIGVSFAHYYHGATAWETLPPIDDHSVHRLDLVKEDVNDPSREAAQRERVAKTLAAGGRIWYVGYPPYIERTAFRGRKGAIVDADNRWSAAFSETVRNGAQHSLVLVEPDGNVIRHERAVVIGFAK
jgi:hypothetical protein